MSSTKLGLWLRALLILGALLALAVAVGQWTENVELRLGSVEDKVDLLLEKEGLGVKTAEMQLAKGD